MPRRSQGGKYYHLKPSASKWITHPCVIWMSQITLHSCCSSYFLTNLTVAMSTLEYSCNPNLELQRNFRMRNEWILKEMRLISQRRSELWNLIGYQLINMTVNMSWPDSRLDDLKLVGASSYSDLRFVNSTPTLKSFWVPSLCSKTWLDHLEWW